MRKNLVYTLLVVMAVLSISSCVKRYSKIYIIGFCKLEFYDYKNNFLGWRARSFFNTLPYTDYDWNSRSTPEELLNFLDIQYNSYEVIYDKVDKNIHELWICVFNNSRNSNSVLIYQLKIDF